MRTRVIAGGCSVAILACALACAADEPVVERRLNARRLTAELLVQFTKAADATNKVVMAQADDASAEFARHAEQANAIVQRDADALKPLLEGLHYSDESKLLEEFARRYDEYRALDRRILAFALENTNVIAERLSFGSAQESADAFRDALSEADRAAPANQAWHVRALAATAVSAVREIQVLQARHIPEDEVAVMTRFEEQMAAAEATARKSVQALAQLLPPASQASLKAANAALDRFMGVHTQIISLSRRNSNVQSLALSLGEKGRLTARCEETLRALQDALAKRPLSGTR